MIGRRGRNKERVDSLFYLWGTERSTRWITSLELTRKIPEGRVEDLFLGEVETVVRLGSKSQFADVGLSTSDSILDQLSLFDNSPLLVRLCLTERSDQNVRHRSQLPLQSSYSFG